MDARLLPFALALSMIVMVSNVSYADDAISPSQVQQGFDISPVPKAQLNLRGNNPAKVGLGSYLVNAIGDCSGCHSFPQYLETGDTAGSNPAAGDPYEGTIDAEHLAPVGRELQRVSLFGRRAVLWAFHGAQFDALRKHRPS